MTTNSLTLTLGKREEFLCSATFKNYGAKLSWAVNITHSLLP